MKYWITSHHRQVRGSINIIITRYTWNDGTVIGLYLYLTHAGLKSISFIDVLYLHFFMCDVYWTTELISLYFIFSKLFFFCSLLITIILFYDSLRQKMNQKKEKVHYMFWYICVLYLVCHTCLGDGVTKLSMSLNSYHKPYTTHVGPRPDDHFNFSVSIHLPFTACFTDRCAIIVWTFSIIKSGSHDRADKSWRWW